MKRRTFLGHSAALTALGELGFLSRLPVVSAQEATLPTHMVRFDAKIELLVRLLEDTPRNPAGRIVIGCQPADIGAAQSRCGTAVAV